MVSMVGAALGACTPGSAPIEPAPPVVVDRMVSTGDGSLRLVIDHLSVPHRQDGASVPWTGATAATVITVSPDERRQTVVGVGAALTDSSAHLLASLPAAERSAALRALFDRDTGAGLSVVRLPIGASDFARSHYTYDDTGEPDPELRHFSIDHDLEAIVPLARQIRRINPEVRFVASPWSPPAWMKDSGSLTHGSLLPEHEHAFAAYLVRFLQAYQDQGIDIGWLTLQNEPEFEPYSYPGMAMSADQQARVISQELGPQLADAGVHTKVLVYDHNWDHPAYPIDVLRQPGVRPTAAGVAFHCYKGHPTDAQDQVHEALGLDVAIWQTECSGGDWQGTRTEAFFGEAALVIGGLEHWASASLLWNLALDPAFGPHTGGCSGCRGVVTVDGDRWTPNLDRDVLAHVGRWVPPGSVRVHSAVTGPAGITTTALRTPGEQIVLLVANPGGARRVTIRSDGLRTTVALRAGSLTTLRWSR